MLRTCVSRANRLACWDGLGRREPCLSVGTAHHVLRFRALAPAVEDSVPTLNGFLPLPFTPAAVKALIMSRQPMPRLEEASNQCTCPATSCESLLCPPRGRWKSSAIAFRPDSSSLLSAILDGSPYLTVEEAVAAYRNVSRNKPASACRCNAPRVSSKRHLKQRAPASTGRLPPISRKAYPRPAESVTRLKSLEPIARPHAIVRPERPVLLLHVYVIIALNHQPLKATSLGP